MFGGAGGGGGHEDAVFVCEDSREDGAFMAWQVEQVDGTIQRDFADLDGIPLWLKGFCQLRLKSIQANQMPVVFR